MKIVLLLLLISALILCPSCVYNESAGDVPTAAVTQATAPETTAEPEDFSGEKIINRLPAFPGTDGIMHDCGDGAYMMIYSPVTYDGFSTYLAGLTADGFRELYRRETSGNTFSSFFADAFLVNAIYTSYGSAARIIIEPHASDDFPEIPGDTGGIYEPTLTQIGQDYGGSDYQSGMSYVLRLPDGTFAVVDGGYYRLTDAVHILECMRSQTEPGRDIVISAWILTHAHNDHIGAFIKFAESYSTLVTLKRIIFNFPSDADCAITGDPTLIGECRRAMNKYPDAQLIKAHPGNIFSFGGAEIEILYTAELYYPDTLDQFNISSLILRFNIGGKTFLVLGDMLMESSRIISYVFGDALKSDMVQVAHHGAKGGSRDLYRLVHPSYVFWPVGYDDYRNYSNLSRNAYFSEATDIIAIWVAKGDTVTVSLTDMTVRGT